MVGPDGHYRGSKGIEKQIVYVALHDDGPHDLHAGRVHHEVRLDERAGQGRIPENRAMTSSTAWQTRNGVVNIEIDDDGKDRRTR